ncbi:putative sugar kinase YdjH [Planctomycetes bacterium Pan216]|uniref:Putative sugar kinase YdjH n=1 Tax=Kolteria novifilia TaxID=2527975 RepID=A0A518B3I2_9BACT|nr:putative sugar kinase YdjH [Planctomycetes bacterium Pan216]
MTLMVVGSIAIDSVQTPRGEASEALGGSACYFAYAASYFAPVRVVGVVGDDFPEDFLGILNERDEIDVSGVKQESGKTFRWKGRYHRNMNNRDTLEVQLNVFGEFDPVIPDAYRDSPYVFLANGSPTVQRKVLHQVNKPKLVVADTMDLWIETARDDLTQLLKEVDGLVLNDSEALMLTEEDLIVTAGKKILDMGPSFVIVKKGEHGAMFFGEDVTVTLPAFPTGQVVDPTGAGDSFAGGLMGYLASQDKLDGETLKRAMAYGTIVASLTVEDYSLNQIRVTDRDQIDKRLATFRDMLLLP